MTHYEENLKRIYDKTNGKCHICGKKLSFINYACVGEKGAWHIEHSIPKAKGGTDHLNNLFPAHIDCNQEKGTYTTQTARGWHGRKRAPLSKDKKKSAKIGNAVLGGTIGLLGYIAGPIVGTITTALGAKIGYGKYPDK
jgi:5-methylcytosine-specific restriction endonuclease McrA